MNVNAALQLLVSALAATKEFDELKRIKDELSKDKTVVNQLNQFQAKQNTLYSSHLSQNQINALMDELNGDYERLQQTPTLKRYFNTVDNFNQLINEVMKGLNTSLENLMAHS